MTSRRRTLVVAVPVATAALFAIQVQLARRKDRAENPTLLLDGLVDGTRRNGRSSTAPSTNGAAATSPLRMLWFGDSTAAGVGATDVELTVPRRVAALLGRPVELRSCAVSGARIADVLDEQVPEFESTGGPAPGLIAISVGANDVTHLTSRRRFVATYEAVLDRLPREAKVVLLGVPDMGSMPRVAQPLRALVGWRGERLASALHTLADRRQLGFVDIADATGRVFRDDPGTSFSADRYHPSDEGYRVWAEAVAPVVEEVLERAGE